MPAFQLPSSPWRSIQFFLVLLISLRRVHAVALSRRPCTKEGFYDAGAATDLPCPGALPCEPGFYCTSGKRIPCPAGTYGDESELRTRECSGPCPAGFYCPIGTASPLECGDTQQFCPLGSSGPLPVPIGFYSIGMAARRRDRVVPCEPGFYCAAGSRYPCPPGTYGATTQLSSSMCSSPCPAGHYCPEGTVFPVQCPPGTYGATTGGTDAICSGLCREGYYCPSGSISPTSNLCGTGTYCPRGSGSPRRAGRGEYVMNGNSQLATRTIDCPVGSYCTSIDGEAELCPPGTYGDRSGLTSPSCSGKCAVGYYCPRGSTTNKAFECGGPEVFCPKGSAEPTPVDRGYYTVGLVSLHSKDQDPADATIRTSQHKCEPGHYCIDGVRTACPAGTYGSAFGLTSTQCSGLCQAGYYCPPRSIVAVAQRCGSSNFFCPEASGTPTRVRQGYCSTNGDSNESQTQTSQRVAKPGEFAFLGTCYACPAGTYGAEFAETNPQCSGPCLPGYFCPPGSSRPTEKECGGANVYCPRGSTQPLLVEPGYYTSTDTQEMCPPGKFRDLSTTVNQFIQLATGRSPVAVNYGDSLYPLAQCVPCPLGTFKPAYGDDSSLCTPCPEFVSTSSSDRRTCECFRLPGGPGFDDSQLKLYFDGVTCSLKSLDWINAAPLDAQHSLFTRDKQAPCDKGFYCMNGVRRPCPAGVYGDTAMENRVTCSGPCAAGYYCPLASTTSTARVCGDASVYCPQGSAVPTTVSLGYYTIRSLPSRRLVTYQVYVALNATSNAHIRDAQQQCERGFYCSAGQKYICPGGRYGDQLGETSPLCAGPCKRGYYCPAGSTSATQLECGGDQWVCRTGSSFPQRIPPGYYSLGWNRWSNSTRFHQQPCEPGFFCVNGVKYQCPAGTFGAVSGLATPACSGRCRAGYYCPSYPSAPSTSATQLECGNSTVFCPEGWGNAPRLVGSGNFSVGAGDGSGDARNTTRVAQQICPRGWYCRGGRRIQCPEGTYGDREGLTSTQCSGWCPAGYFCPQGTADYRTNVCPTGTYATAGSAYCMPCGVGGKNPSAVPAQFHLVSGDLRIYPCVDKRECCFAG